MFFFIGNLGYSQKKQAHRVAAQTGERDNAGQRSAESVNENETPATEN